jgi:hypothetical protein
MEKPAQMTMQRKATGMAQSEDEGPSSHAGEFGVNEKAGGARWLKCRRGSGYAAIRGA